MVHPAQHGNVQIAEISGDQVSGDLPGAILQDLVPTSPAIDHKVHIVGLGAVANDIRVGWYQPRSRTEAVKRLPVVCGQLGDIREFSYERF